MAAGDRHAAIALGHGRHRRHHAPQRPREEKLRQQKCAGKRRDRAPTRMPEFEVDDALGFVLVAGLERFLEMTATPWASSSLSKMRRTSPSTPG